MRIICIIILLVFCFVSGCDSGASGEAGDSSSVSKEYPYDNIKYVVEKEYDGRYEAASKSAENALEMAKKTEKVSPSLALINYIICLELYKEDHRQPYLNKSYLAQRISKDGITTAQLKDVIIPHVKSEALNAASEDIFELMLFYKSLGESGMVTRTTREILEIAYVMERTGQTERASKLMEHIISSDGSVTKPSLLGGKLVDYARRDMESGNKEKVMKKLDDALQPYKNYKPVGLGITTVKEATQIYLKYNMPEKAMYALLLLYDPEKRLLEKGHVISVLRDAVRDNNLGFALDFMHEINKEEDKFLILDAIVDEVVESEKYVALAENLDELSEIVKGEREYSRASGYKDKAALKLAVCYFKVGKNEKSEEIIDRFFSISRIKKPSHVQISDEEYRKQVLEQNPKRKQELLYRQIRGDHFEMIRILDRCNQTERARLVIDEKLKYTRHENISKDMVPGMLLQIARSYLYLGNDDNARTVFEEFVQRKDGYGHNKTKYYTYLLNFAVLFNDYDDAVIAQKCLDNAYAFIVKFVKDGNSWNHNNHRNLTTFLKLLDYDTAFEVAELQDKYSMGQHKYKLEMAKKLLDNGQIERAKKMGLLLESASNTDPILKAQFSGAKNLIKSGKLDEALEIAETMKGDNKRGYISGIKLETAYEYAQLGSFDKAISLIENTDGWSSGSSMRNVGNVLMHYVDGNNPSSSEQKAIIGKLLDDIKMLDYETSLSGSTNYGLRDKSLVKLAMKAENDVLDCATYIAKKGWGNQINTATHLTLYAQGLFDLKLCDQIPQVIEDAVRILQADSDKSAYVDLYLDLADIWIKLGENEKAIELIDIYKDANKIAQDYGPRFDDILAIPLAYRKAGSTEKVDEFFAELDSGKFFFEEKEYDRDSLALKASWLANNGKYDEACELFASEKLGDREWSRTYYIPEIAIENGDYEIALKQIHGLEEIRNRIYLLSNLVDAMTTENLEVDVVALFDPVLKELESSQDVKSHVGYFGNIAEKYHKAGYVDKAKDLLDKTLESAKKLPDDKYGRRPEHTLANSFNACGYYDEALKLYPKNVSYDALKKSQQLQIAFDKAKTGDFDTAIDAILQQDCLSRPKETLALISKLMIEAGLYDRAFETLDLVSDPAKVKRCPEHGMMASMGNPYDVFPELFVDAGRIDLALKILKYLRNDDLILPLMYLEKAIRESGYQLTADDKTALRSLIHTDKRYVLYPQEQ